MHNRIDPRSQNVCMCLPLLLGHVPRNDPRKHLLNNKYIRLMKIKKKNQQWTINSEQKKKS